MFDRDFYIREFTRSNPKPTLEQSKFIKRLVDGSVQYYRNSEKIKLSDILNEVKSRKLNISSISLDVTVSIDDDNDSTYFSVELVDNNSNKNFHLESQQWEIKCQEYVVQKQKEYEEQCLKSKIRSLANKCLNSFQKMCCAAAKIKDINSDYVTRDNSMRRLKALIEAHMDSFKTLFMHKDSWKYFYREAFNMDADLITKIINKYPELQEVQNHDHVIHDFEL